VNLAEFGVTAGARLIGGYAERADDLRPAMDAALEDLFALGDQVWATRGRVIGAPWPALSPRTLDSRRSQGKGDTPLEYSGGRGGVLRKSLTRRGAAHQRVNVTRDEVLLETTSGIAGVHQSGGAASDGGRVPQRRMVADSGFLAGRFVPIFAGHLAGNARRGRPGGIV